jgi:predicted DNA binding CopG/RHH family protein
MTLELKSKQRINVRIDGKVYEIAESVAMAKGIPLTTYVHMLIVDDLDRRKLLDARIIELVQRS